MGDKPLQIGQKHGNFMVGTVAPVMKEPQIEKKFSPLLSFIEQAMPAFQKIVKNDMDASEVQGALDAAATTDRLEENNETLKKYNWWCRGAYKRGYEGAAAVNLVNKYQDELATLRKTSLDSGDSDEVFARKLNDLNGKHASELWARTKDLPVEKGKAIAELLRTGNISTLQQYRKDTAALAYKRDFESTNALLSSSIGRVTEMISSGEPQAALFEIQQHINLALTNSLLSKEDKHKQIGNYVDIIASTSKDPSFVNTVNNMVFEKLGGEGNTLIKGLAGREKEAAQKGTTELMLHLNNEMASLESLPPALREQKEAELAALIRQGNVTHTLSDDKAVWYMEKLREGTTKIKKDELIVKDILSGQFTLDQIANAWGLTAREKASFVNKVFPDSPEGDANMLMMASQTRDNDLLRIGLKRNADRVTSAINGAMYMSKDGELPEGTAQTIEGAIALYNGLDNIDKAIWLENFPEDMRSLISITAASSPSNVTGTLLDTVRTSRDAWASGNLDPKYKKFDAANFKDLKGSVLSNWSDYFNSAGTNQEIAAMDGIANAYNEIILQFPHLAKTPDLLINAAVERARTKRVEISVEGLGNVHLYPPAGRSFSDMFKNAKVDAVRNDPYVQGDAISRLVNSKASGLTGITMVTASMGSGGDGLGMTLTFFREDSYITEHVDSKTLETLATGLWEDKISRASGDTRGIMAPSVTDVSVDSTTKRSITFGGRNTFNVRPDVISYTLANTAGQEGVLTKAKDVIDPETGKVTGRTIGIGSHSSSGDFIPDEMSVEEAMQRFEGTMHQRYIPAAIRAINRNQLAGGDYALPLITDLAFHGWSGSAAPVAKAMSDYQKTRTGFHYNTTPADRENAERKLFHALESTSAFKKSGSRRQAYLISELRKWADYTSPEAYEYRTTDPSRTTYTGYGNSNSRK